MIGQLSTFRLASTFTTVNKILIIVGCKINCRDLNLKYGSALFANVLQHCLCKSPFLVVLVAYFRVSESVCGEFLCCMCLQIALPARVHLWWIYIMQINVWIIWTYYSNLFIIYVCQHDLVSPFQTATDSVTTVCFFDEQIRQYFSMCCLRHLRNLELKKK